MKKPRTSDIFISSLSPDSIDRIVHAFHDAGWNKPKTLFLKYLREQEAGERPVLVGWKGEKILGYATLVWHSAYNQFRSAKIPEIVDLNVLPSFRKQGFASRLISECEWLAKEKGCQEIGLGVGLTREYGPAQKLYFKLGFAPNAKGLHYGIQSVEHGEKVIADDSLVIYLTKKLK